jgi:transcriptional regulator
LSDSELGSHLDALSDKFENWLTAKPPWTSSKMTAGRLETMKGAIVGLVMSVDEVEGSFKLNQHKSDVDYVAVALELARQPEPAARILAREMRALRPQLFADETTELNVKATPGGTM